MLRKYILIVLFAAFSLVACDNGGYDTRTGDAQTDAGTDRDAGTAETSPEPNTGTAGTRPEMESDPEMGAPREREMDTRTGDIRTRPNTGSETDSDTGIDFGASTNPGTGSTPETSPREDTGTGTSDDITGSP